MIDPSYYEKLREPFTPREVKLVLLFESPPASGNYFYDSEGMVSEPLFRAIMKLFGWKPETKTRGLEYMQKNGIVLLDATHLQVNNMTRGHLVRA